MPSTSPKRLAQPATRLLLLAMLALFTYACKDEQPPTKTTAAATPPATAAPTAKPSAVKPAPRSSISSSTSSTPATPSATPPAQPTAIQQPAIDPNAPPAPTITSSFPGNRTYSRTLSSDATLTPTNGPLIESGSGILTPPVPGNRPDPQVIVTGIKAPKQYTVVQFPLAGEQAYTYLKAAINLAANLQPIYVEDPSGQTYSPVGYMISKGEKLEFKLDPENGLRTVSQIPGVKTLTKEETIWLVFYIPKGTTLTKFVAGNKKAAIDLSVP